MKKSLLFAACSIAFSSAAFAYQDVTPTEAYQMAANDPNTFILDVRTEAEWKWVGHPGQNALLEGAALDGKVVNISYMVDKKGTMIVNKKFLKDIDDLVEDEDITLITMCRSGKRSAAAAALLEGEGYSVANMVTGFEGGKDAAGYRTVNGWANDGLPFNYSGAGYRR